MMPSAVRPSAVALFGEALDAFDEDSEDEATVLARALSSAVRSWFLSLLSRQQEGAEAAAKAADTLRASADPEALWLALVCLALGVAYLGEDWTAVADEGVALGETLDGPFWAVSFKNWRGGAALMASDFETGKRVLLEGMEVYRQLDERYWLSANFQHQAQIAIPEGRIEDAIDLFGRSVVKAREVGTVRVLQMSLTGLGDANMAAGNFADAETAFIESLATSEQMGLVREMLDLLRKVANARANVGQKQETVEMLATITAEPSSSQPSLWTIETIAELASAALAELQEDMDPDAYSAAHAAGTSRLYDVAAKELINSQSRPPEGSFS